MRRRDLVTFVAPCGRGVAGRSNRPAKVWRVSHTSTRACARPVQEDRRGLR